jgi:hypothetical protein
MTIRLPVQTASCPARLSGASTVEVGVQESVRGSYRPPVLLPPPPHTTIVRPVHTAVWDERGEGAPTVEVGVHVSVAGS